MNRFLIGLLSCCVSLSTLAAEPIRLAPPEAMFRESIHLQQFVRGTLRFVLLHEAGHGFVDLYDIPVLGREEDAADRFATWWMGPSESEDGTDAIAAMEWWLALGEHSELSRQQLAWWDEHGIDEQRGYQIICLLYGTDPKTMGPLAGRTHLPEDRRESCIPEAKQNDLSWRAYLSGNTARAPMQLDGFLVPVKYLPAEAEGNQAAASLAQEWQVLEELAAMLKQFRFPEGEAMIRLVGKECGTPNAYWDGEEHTITLCYELVNLVADVGVAAGFTPESGGTP